tara:strand:+ start:739 stop:873 length:135 start_codon:yes stop_codon:yes gene_type:complete
MNDKEIKAIIERSSELLEKYQLKTKIQYIMDFGNFSIQYDFSIN